MHAGEIEDEICKLAEAPFDAAEFPYQFLQAFGVSDAAVAKLKAGRDNKSDVPGAVLQRSRNNIHLKVCPKGEVAATLQVLRDSEATKKLKAKYLLATDGEMIGGERLRDGMPIACAYTDLPNHFGVLLELAGISTTPKIDENTFDIRATNKLNKLYLELRGHNKDWDTNARRQDLNHFFARLIFCFFAEDTGIFEGIRLFTDTVEKYTDRTGSNVHEVLSECFRAMNVRKEDRAKSDLRPFAMKFEYVNGNLFSGTIDTPKFNQAARIHLLAVGSLNWKLVNPDIFGSMIQAVADDEERGEIGMHYTSVPNILKVLNPLFLDDLRQKLEEAGDGSTPASKGQLTRLRDRLSKIRVFDPACGSGNFLVIAYKEMRKIEADINARRGERDLPTVIPMTNFRGIELRGFAAEIARLALIIAKFQCDSLHIGDLFARKQVLPLDKENWITKGNALRLDWLDVMDARGTGVKLTGDDLFNTPKDQVEIDFENAGGETYICGNPPYAGRKYQTADQKQELRDAFGGRCKDTLSLDYVTGWFIKAVDYMEVTKTASAFVATNSICQGIQVASLWPVLFSHGASIVFAHLPFKWSNLASHNAGVSVAIIGMSKEPSTPRRLYDLGEDGQSAVRSVDNINGYLVPAKNVFVSPVGKVPDERTAMQFGNHPYYANALMLRRNEVDVLVGESPEASRFIRPLYGSNETISSQPRYCLWITSESLAEALTIPAIAARIRAVKVAREEKRSDKQSLKLVSQPFRFRDQYSAEQSLLIVPIVSSESRDYLPIELKDSQSVVHNKAFALYDAPLWNFALIASRLHLVWIGTVCGRLEMRFSYSNTLGWNTFPVPPLKEQDKADLTRCAEDILLAREARFPATIADLYDPETMPADLKAAHDRNDERLESIYIGRRFKNDTERLEKLFSMYTEMTGKMAKLTPGKVPRKPRRPKGAEA